jgi:AcrR family transcriptional regulator
MGNSLTRKARAQTHPPERPAARRSGRRPGQSGTRAAILGAAGRQFAERGYDRISMRSIATEAGVDPKLVAYFFRSKRELLFTALEPPFNPPQAAPRIFAEGRERVGERLAAYLLELLEDPAAQARIVGLLRAAVTEPEAARMVRDLREEHIGPIWDWLAESVETEDARLRAALVFSQMAGLILARQIIGVEPLASMAPDDISAAIAPTFQRYLAGELRAEPSPSSPNEGPVNEPQDRLDRPHRSAPSANGC